MTDEPLRIPCIGGVVRHDGWILLVLRGQEPSLGLWSIPGGRLEDGETAPEGCAREVLEETGLRVTVGPWVGQVERAAPSGGIYVIDDYLCSPVSAYAGEPPPPTAGDDAADARWFTSTDLVALDAAGQMAPGVLNALHDWNVLPDPS
jgi:ADP-ribose pyrophosphatase YjhB (NUDIX family)